MYVASGVDDLVELLVASMFLGMILVVNVGKNLKLP
jgi:hypothetical protein